MIISREKFIEIWQTSDSIIEVCQKTGLTYNTARIKSERLRGLGIPLKRIGKQVSVDKLIRLANSLEVDNDQSA